MQITPSYADHANRDAEFIPADPDDPTTLPSVQVGGAQVFVYIDPDDGLRISVHLDQTAPDLVTQNGTVPMRIVVGDDDVFTGD
jgi:hypothetical protein